MPKISCLQVIIWYFTLLSQVISDWKLRCQDHDKIKIRKMFFTRQDWKLRRTSMSRRSLGMLRTKNTATAWKENLHKCPFWILHEFCLWSTYHHTQSGLGAFHPPEAKKQISERINYLSFLRHLSCWRSFLKQKLDLWFLATLVALHFTPVSE